LKFFPAEAAGGMAYLKSMAAPYLHLDVRFIPLGGLDASNLERYLAEPLIHAVGGSWIASRELIQKRDWPAITQRARQATQIVARLRPRSP
jgi:2-dehydro-3-deoxyphosphogluconate aldolase/(4S)-4-hydroxy-2-oxoglutarate aldolase